MLKKILGSIMGILLLASVSCVGTAFAGDNASDTKWIVVVDSAIVHSVNHATSTVMGIGDYENFGYKLVVHTDDSTDVKLEYQIIESNQGDSAYVDSGLYHGYPIAWITPVNGVLDASVTASQADGFSPMVTKWIRFLVTGSSGNGTDTQISLYMSVYGER